MEGGPLMGMLSPKNDLHEKLRKRLLKEADELCRSSPSPNFYASPQNENLREWRAVLIGPPETVYERGLFFISITIPDDYPFKPPDVRFLTRIYHCNINSNGVVCLDILRGGWRPTFTLKDVMFGLVSLLYAANPQDPLVGSIAREFENNRAEHDRVAALWTRRFALCGYTSYEQQEAQIQDRASRNRVRREVNPEDRRATEAADSLPRDAATSTRKRDSSSCEDDECVPVVSTSKRTRVASGNESDGDRT